MNRERITGILHRSRQRKFSSRHWMAQFAESLAVDAGLREPQFYPEDMYVSGDTESTVPGSRKIWSFRTRTFRGGISEAIRRAFDGVPDGARVEFEATVRHWDNGGGHSRGADCTRVRLIGWTAPNAPNAEALAGPKEAP